MLTVNTSGLYLNQDTSDMLRLGITREATCFWLKKTVGRKNKRHEKG